MCSETRAAHKLSAKLNRDIIIGGTTLDTPSEFLEHLKVIHKALLASLACHGLNALNAMHFPLQITGLHGAGCIKGVPIFLQELGNAPESSSLEVEQGNGWS